MYKKNLRQRMSPNKASHFFSFQTKPPNEHSKLSLKSMENLQKELDAHQTKRASILFRKKLLEHQTKANYTNELQRIRGELSRNDTRLPQGTRLHLHNRMTNLKALGAQIVDEIK